MLHIWWIQYLPPQLVSDHHISVVLQADLQADAYLKYIYVIKSYSLSEEKEDNKESQGNKAKQLFII